MAKYKLGPDIDLDIEEIYDDETGERITEATAQDVADDVINRARTRGRPSLTGAGKKSPQVTFRLTPELKAQAESLAAAEHVTVSALSRRLLENYVDEHSR